MTHSETKRMELFREFPNLQQALEAHEFVFGCKPDYNPTPLKDIRPDIADGIYYIYEDQSIEQFTSQNPRATVKYIGVKCGDHSVAVTLHDVTGGDEDGEHQLLPDTDQCPKDSPHYSWDRETDTYRFNAHEDFDGKGNTERLRSYGCQIPLNDGEWIPSVGELTIICMNLTKVNEALEKAGGDKLQKWAWASTEHSSSHAWYVNFGSGSFGGNCKCYSTVVRAVAAFI